MVECTHVYYIYPILLDTKRLGISRECLHKALDAEGVSGLVPGYVNLHLLPMYQYRRAYGSSGFPWSSNICRRYVDYRKGICPVAEELHESSFLGIQMCLYDYSFNDTQLIAEAFQKVWAQLDKLQ